jgi:hypothetical protein
MTQVTQKLLDEFDALPDEDRAVHAVYLLSIACSISDSLNVPGRRENPGAGTKQVQRMGRAPGAFAPSRATGTP